MTCPVQGHWQKHFSIWSLRKHKLSPGIASSLHTSGGPIALTSSTFGPFWKQENRTLQILELECSPHSGPPFWIPSPLPYHPARLTSSLVLLFWDLSLSFPFCNDNHHGYSKDHATILWVQMESHVFAPLFWVQAGAPISLYQWMPHSPCFWAALSLTTYWSILECFYSRVSVSTLKVSR